MDNRIGDGSSQGGDGVELYLVTGFLGAGKTTFLKEMIRLLEPCRLSLIVNEFGAVGVDGQLLADMGATLAEINNGSVFCSCRIDRFEQELERAVNAAPDVILVEASGLSDPTNVRQVLGQFSEISYRGSICLADALRLPKVFATARMCQKQLAVSSLVLLNKADVSTSEQLEEAERIIYSVNPAAQVERTSFGKLEPKWLKSVHADIDVRKAKERMDITLQKCCLSISPRMTQQQMKHCLALLSESTFRIKGFVCLEKEMLLVDCTGPNVKLTPWHGQPPAEENCLVLLSGQGLPLRQSVKTAETLYKELVVRRC